MRISDLRNGPVYVIGSHTSYPPAYLNAPGNGTWTWTRELLDAFPFHSEREAYLKMQDPAVARLVHGMRVGVLEITLNIRSL